MISRRWARAFRIWILGAIAVEQRADGTLIILLPVRVLTIGTEIRSAVSALIIVAAIARHISVILCLRSSIPLFCPTFVPISFSTFIFAFATGSLFRRTCVSVPTFLCAYLLLCPCNSVLPSFYSPMPSCLILYVLLFFFYAPVLLTLYTFSSTILRPLFSL